MAEVTDKIKKLLESPVPEDIAIGLKILIKQEKIRKQEDLRKVLTYIKFNNTVDIDLYISYFNIFIYDDGSPNIYYCKTAEYGNGTLTLKV